MNTESTEESDQNYDLNTIYTNLKDFINILIPTADLISQFNGNFVYLIPNQGFSASNVYT